MKIVAELSVDSFKRLSQRIKTLINSSSDNDQQMITEIIERTYDFLIIQLSQYVDTGDLINSVSYNIIKNGSGWEGIIKVSSTHAQFREFGIGVRGSGTNYPTDTPFEPYTYGDTQKGYTGAKYMYNTYKYMESIIPSVISKYYAKWGRS